MADANRKEKLAAAKKKLKKFQKQKGGTPNGKRDTPPPQLVKEKTPNGPKSAPLMNGTHHEERKPKDSPSASKSQQPSHSKSPSSSDPPATKMTASTEKLQQLSRQINGLITEMDKSFKSTAYMNGVEEPEVPGVSDLESRNSELASMVETHNQANQQMNKQMQELRSQNQKLQQNLEKERTMHEEKLKRELGSLKEQLQVHIQTIGILVAEKTELQSSLNQNQKMAEQRMEEVEELSGRLKASRQRVADLERNFSSASTSSHKHEKSSKEMSKEVDRLKLELYQASKSSEEFQQRNSELQGKLQDKVAQCAKLEDSMIELKGKLEMTELYVQQLQNQGLESAQSKEELERLHTERTDMQARLDQYTEAFQKLTAERDQLTEQYQQYIEQLSAQNQHLQSQINALNSEKEQLIVKEKQLTDVITELNNRIERLKDLPVDTESPDPEESACAVREASEAENAQLKQSAEALQQLAEQYQQLNNQYQAQVSDNTQLSRLVDEKEVRILELEQQVSRLGEESVDKAQLLDSMHSDKTALSRAIAQNKELKNQLGELQSGFVKMSNDNMDMLTKLQEEQHVSKELATRLSQQEEELKEIRETLSEKEHQLSEMQQKTESMSIEHYTTQQIEDRLRHYDAQVQLIETLQRELSSAQDTINALTTQNTDLRGRVLHTENAANGNTDEQHSMLESLNSSVRQLEMERDQILEQLTSEKGQHAETQNKLTDVLSSNTPAVLDGEAVSLGQFDALQRAMKQLEGKYTAAMRDKADLVDENEQLEHRIMQLQGETDTIGEYITLYQTQRNLLRERQVQKDDFISQLSRERGEMQDKLVQLQTLVMQLLGEKQMYQNHNDSHNLAMAASHLAHSTPSHNDGKGFGSNLDSSHLEDWPDYSTDTDSDTSEVEAIVAGSPPDDVQMASNRNSNKNLHDTSSGSTSSGTDMTDAPPSLPHNNPTAQKIMHLLTEMGHVNMAMRTRFEGDTHFVHCNHCSGNIQNV